MENLNTYRIIEKETGILEDEFQASSLERAKERLSKWSCSPERLTLEVVKPLEYVTFTLGGA